MKFLCGNCKAKYQIGDEKVSGRTLRMKCRRCGHDILIDGHGMAPAPSPPRRTGGSSVSVLPEPPRSGAGMPAAIPPRPAPPTRPAPVRSKPPPSPLSTEFRRHVAAPPAVPARSAPYDLWHAAIQDVPVGPMTREELARKVESGAVTASSLCWREGMDDWRPLGELAELQGLLRRTQAAARPSVRPGKAPPAVPSPVGARHPSFFPEGVEELDEEGSEPTRIADVTGPVRPVASASVPHHKVAPSAPPPPPPPVVEVPAPPAVAVPTAPIMTEPSKRKPGMSGTTGLIIGITATLALIGGPGIWSKFFEEPTTPAPVAPMVQNAPKPVEAKAPELEVPEPQPVKDQATTEPVKKPRNSNGPVAKAHVEQPKGPKLSAEEQKLLERMGGAGPDINTKQPGVGGGGGAPTGPSLTASQLMKVVQDNKPALQRCYETALRAVGGKQDDTIKIQVEVTVGASGTVTSVNTNGQGLGDMNRCLSSSVRRWRFPQSGGESAFAFPLVFQPGA